MLLQRVVLPAGFLHLECRLRGNNDQICNVFNTILLCPPPPPPGGCFNHGERGGPRPGRLRQHVRAQQLQTRPPSSTTGPVGRNTVLPGTRYSAGLLFVSPPVFSLCLFDSTSSVSLPPPPRRLALHSAPPLSPLHPLSNLLSCLSFLSLSRFLPRFSIFLPCRVSKSS